MKRIMWTVAMEACSAENADVLCLVAESPLCDTIVLYLRAAGSAKHRCRARASA
jgi:hypothetical protein